jgi:hypothetical protein
MGDALSKSGKNVKVMGEEDGYQILSINSGKYNFFLTSDV